MARVIRDGYVVHVRVNDVGFARYHRVLGAHCGRRGEALGCQECVSETVAERIWGGEKGRGGREGSRTGGNVDEDIRDLGDGAGGALGVHQHPPDHRLHEPELEVWAHERRVRHVRFLVQRAVEISFAADDLSPTATSTPHPVCSAASAIVACA